MAKTTITLVFITVLFFMHLLPAAFAEEYRITDPAVLPKGQSPAIPDGKHDCAPVINALLAAMPAEGGTIVIPTGSFLLKSPLIVRSNFVTIRGENEGERSGVDTKVDLPLYNAGSGSYVGGGSKLLLDRSCKIGIQVEKGSLKGRLSSLVVKDLLISGAATSAAQTGIAIYQDNDSIRIRNVCCIGLDTGIDVRAADAAQIVNCWIAECRNCLRMDVGQQNLISGCDLGGQPLGITCDFTNQDRMLFVGNLLFPDGYTGLRLTNGTHCSLCNNVISGYYTGLIEVTGSNNSLSTNNISVRRLNGMWAHDPHGRDDSWGLIRISGDDNQFTNSLVYSEQPNDDSRVHCVSGRNNVFSDIHITGNPSRRKIIVNGTNSSYTSVIYCGRNGEIDLGHRDEASHPDPMHNGVVYLP